MLGTVEYSNSYVWSLVDALRREKSFLVLTNTNALCLAPTAVITIEAGMVWEDYSAIRNRVNGGWSSSSVVSRGGVGL